MDDFRLWGLIVYGFDSSKWGILWNYVLCCVVVVDVCGNCVGVKCLVELFFYGKSCGVFVIFDKFWLLVQCEGVQCVWDVVFDECGKVGKVCCIIGVVCVDGFGC